MDVMKLALNPCALGEGPMWHRETGEFVFTDIVKGTLFAATEDGAVRTLLQCRYQIGAFLFDTNGDLLIMTEAGIFLCPYGGAEEDFQLLWKLPMQPGERFNDAICDAKGRILAGTKLPADRDGSLWMLEKGKEPVRLLKDIRITNGMGFSPDGKTLYHTDSGFSEVRRYGYDVETGTIEGGEVLISLADEPAVPDGMTVDANGDLWVACWDGSCVRRYTPEGVCAQVISIPAMRTSSAMFGGKDLDTLLVTSAAIGLTHPQEGDGGIWLLKPGVAGVEEHRVIV